MGNCLDNSSINVYFKLTYFPVNNVILHQVFKQVACANISLPLS